MSHLGDLLSAHVDGELDGAERDKVSAHLARCEQCRAESAELRVLKARLSALATEAPAEADMTRRLLEIAEVAAVTGPIGGRTLTRRSLSRRSLTRKTLPRKTLARTAGKPGGPRLLTRPRLNRRRRYLVLSTVSIVMGLGAVAFSVGGAESAPGPRINPPVELYSEEHAITTGGVPFAGPGPEMGAEMGPAMTTAARPETTGTASPGMFAQRWSKQASPVPLQP